MTATKAKPRKAVPQPAEPIPPSVSAEITITHAVELLEKTIARLKKEGRTEDAFYLQPCINDLRFRHLLRVRQTACTRCARLPRGCPDRRAVPVSAAMTDTERGLYGKYAVIRYDRKPVNWAFVLEDKDPLAVPALQAYRDAACEAGSLALGRDLTDAIINLRSEHDLAQWDREHEAPDSESGAMTQEDTDYLRDRGRFMRESRDRIKSDEQFRFALAEARGES